MWHKVMTVFINMGVYITSQFTFIKPAYVHNELAIEETTQYMTL